MLRRTSPDAPGAGDPTGEPTLRAHGAPPVSDAGRETGARVVDGHAVPDPLPPGWAARPLAGGDRRRVLLGGGSQVLGELPRGSAVVVYTPADAVLLSALHPHLRSELHPVPPRGRRERSVQPGPRGGVPESGPAAPSVHRDAQGGRATGGVGAADGGEDPPGGPLRVEPAWWDPAAAAQGQILDEAAWLPLPGEGLPVMVGPAEELQAATPAGLRDEPPEGRVWRVERAILRPPLTNGFLRVRAWHAGNRLRAHALFLAPDGRRAVRAEAAGPGDDPAGLAAALHALLLERGAQRVAAGHRPIPSNTPNPDPSSS